MSAGTGVVHSEINGGERPCRLLQVWVQPSSNGIEPAYEQKPFPLLPGWTPLLDPQRRDGAMAIHRPVQLWRSRLQPGEALALPPAQGALWIQMVDGALMAPWTLQRGDGLGWMAAHSAAAPSLTASAAGADLLFFALH
jgi:redox-sensitive bicupin YhaK (pirin superfamily)